MRTDVISFVLSSENRKRIVRTIFEYPKRQWSCSALEELTKIPHATVFRTLTGLRDFGVLKSFKVNKRDVIYELVRGSPLLEELKKIINIEKTTTRKIAGNFANNIKSKNIYSVILYGSSVNGDLRPGSDIDILIILKNHNRILEKRVFDTAAKLSSKLNRTISVIIMDLKEMDKEKNSRFIRSLRSKMEVIYGKKAF